MLRKSINSAIFLLGGLFFLGLGLALFFTSKETISVLLRFIAGGLIVLSIIDVIGVIIKKERSKYLSALFRGTIDIFFGLFIVNNISFTTNSLIVLFGIYVLVHSLLHLLNYYIYKVANIKGRLIILIKFIVCLVISLFLTFKPSSSIHYAGIIIGIYLVIVGLLYLSDFISEVVPKKVTNNIKNQIRIPMPIILTTFIPRQLIQLVNETLEVEHPTNIFEGIKEDDSPDIFVIFHLANSGTASFGHVEIAFEGKTYSYGNYDRHSRTLFDSVGDGVIAVANKRDYMQYAINIRDRYLVEFGIKLTKEQIEKAREQIQRLVTKDTVSYYPDLQLAEMGLLEMRSYHDMSSEIYKLAGGKFYKITKGHNKKFFVFKNNCTIVTETILGSLGKSIISINGIISPGAYYDYLNNEFKKKNTNVITRKVFTKENIEEIE